VGSAQDTTIQCREMHARRDRRLRPVRDRDRRARHVISDLIKQAKQEGYAAIPGQARP
jgi:hypothetical protein